SPGTCPGVTTTTSTPNTFSIQLNTNRFTTTYGGTGWVQFVYQTATPSTKERLCVWKVDVGVANATNNASGYDPKCSDITSTRTLFGQSAAGSREQNPIVKGWVGTDEGGAPTITAWAQLPWASSNPVLVVAPDTITGSLRGLPNDTKEYPFGLKGRWTNVSGD